MDTFTTASDSLIQGTADGQQRPLASFAKVSVSLGPYRPAVDRALSQLEESRIVDRIWARDHTVWKPEPVEIANRLGWLDTGEAMIGSLDCLAALREDLRDEGYTDVLVLGMGGSSLAPEVFHGVFASASRPKMAGNGLKLAVIDSTDPGAVLVHARRLDPEHAVFVVASKSGNTAETMAFLRFFYNWAANAVGMEQAGRRFVAIADPGSLLAKIAQDLDFRATFLNDPNIGGRYSALSYFGLVPAALIGVDLETLVDRSLVMACASREPSCVGSRANPAALLGSTIAELALAGRDKLTLILSPAISSLGDWIEQLIAESSGKEGRGILPVVGEPMGPPEVYGADRVFVYLRLEGVDDASKRQNQVLDEGVSLLEEAGHPVIRLSLRDSYDLGEQFFLWEMATAIACHRLGVNPFDQPNVEAAKSLARQILDRFAREGALGEDDTIPLLPESLTSFLATARRGDYIAVQAYVQPTEEMDGALTALRSLLREEYGLATTAGYGPRYLHSTGQLHKGDSGRGLFVQLVGTDREDAAIPDEAGSPASSLTFGVFKEAQALGDRQALRDAGRRATGFRVGVDAVRQIASVVAKLGESTAQE